jgi:thiamine pyrophosphokinase
MNTTTIILANGLFPTHAIPLRALREASRIVCCDGAANRLVDDFTFSPVAIVGDGDSLSDDARTRWSDICVTSTCQETNDLQKAFRYCVEKGWTELVILGATGKREDHTLGNISLLADFSREATVSMVTDACLVTPVSTEATLPSAPQHPVSFIACDPQVRLTVEGVHYPVRDLALTRWATATLNVATGAFIRVIPSGGTVLVFQAFGSNR